MSLPQHPDRERPAADQLAGRLATVAGALGILAGVIDAAVGPSIRSWIGGKSDPTRLGLLTVILSAVALTAARRWQRPGGRDGDRRMATILAFLLPAAVCFTTIGRLWYIPGLLLLGAGALVVRASTRSELALAITREHWLTGLTVLLGAYYVFLGGDALPSATGVLGILGGLAIWAALMATERSRRLGLVLLIAGATPFALATWWSVVTPLTALLVLTIGPLAMRPRATGARTAAWATSRATG